MKKTSLGATLGLICGMSVPATHAAVLNTGDMLTITAGVPVIDSNQNSIDIASGSYFGWDGNNDYKITGTEKTAISPGLDGALRIGTTQHAVGSDSTNADALIDQWNFLGLDGHDFTAVAPMGGTTAGIDFSGWRWHWNATVIDMGGNAWQPLNCTSLGCSGYTFTDGVARFQWDGVYGHAYTLDYAAQPPANDPSGLAYTSFYWHLEGTVQAVPVPAAVWLFGSGLAGVFGFGRLKKLRT